MSWYAAARAALVALEAYVQEIHLVLVSWMCSKTAISHLLAKMAGQGKPATIAAITSCVDVDVFVAVAA